MVANHLLKSSGAVTMPALATIKNKTFNQISNFMKHISFKQIVITWAIFSFFASLIQAQTSPEGFLQKNKTSDLVFEGKVVSQISELSSDMSTILTKSTVKVYKVFQGELRDGICKIITPGGVSDDRFMIYGKALQLVPGDNGLFWVRKGEIPFDKQRSALPNEYWAIKQSDFLPTGTRYTDEKMGGESSDMFGEVSRLLGDPLFESPKDQAPSQPESIDCSDPNFENWSQISLQNIQITNNNTALECDVVLKAYPAGIKFGKGQVTFTLPKSVFGSNVVNNQDLVVQKGEILSSSNYLISYANLTDSTVAVQIGQLSSSAFSYPLVGDYKVLLHVKATIINPVQLVALTPAAFNFSGQLEFLCGGVYAPFDKTEFIAPNDIFPPNFENPIGIHYSLDRFYHNGNNGFLFDIFARSDDPSNYKSGKLYIDYDNATFGSNIAGSIITVGGVLAGNSAYTVGIFDEDANTLRLEIIAAGNSNLIQLNLATQLLLRFQVFLLNCNQNLGLKWNALTISPNHTYIEGGAEFQYMPVTASGEFLNKICACNEPSSPNDPVITSLSSTSVKAGVGEVLTIMGNKFGNGFVEGQCYIEVDNADHSPSNKTKVPAADIISWTNTEIKFYVPSTTIGQTQAPMESGPVKVVNYCGSSNTKDVEVEYAVLNFRSQSQKLAQEVGLAMNTPSEIQFEYYTTGMDDDAITMIEEGLEAWRCANTQIKWRTTVSGTSFSVQDPGDLRNIIKAVPANQVPTAFAAVIVGGYAKNCGTSGSPVYYFDNVDILVNKDINWDAFNTLHRNIFKHELGHAHLLQHASYLSSNDEKILHYSYAVFQSIKPEDRAGGLHVLAAAPAILNGCTGVDIVQQMACTNSVDDHAFALGINVSPNPFTGDFSLIGDEAALSGLIPYKIFDVFGAEVAEGRLRLNSPLQDLGDKPSGVYFISVLIEGKTLVFKVIKQ